MDIAYTGVWGYHPFSVNWSGNRPSSEGGRPVDVPELSALPSPPQIFGLPTQRDPFPSGLDRLNRRHLGKATA